MSRKQWYVACRVLSNGIPSQYVQYCETKVKANSLLNYIKGHEKINNAYMDFQWKEDTKKHTTRELHGRNWEKVESIGYLL
jgi:hypothetical protein